MDDPDATLPLPGMGRPRELGRSVPGVGAQLGPWRLEALAGQGSFGRVFRARHGVTGGVRALKVLHGALSGTAEAVLGFLQEARLSARIVHPAVVSAEDIRDGRAAGPSWSVARWVDGPALSAVLRCGPPPLAHALRVGAELAGALAAVHASGVVHGDCKPDNVLISPDGGIHLVDFGAAWELGSAPRTVQGTPAYLAPEVWTEGPLDGRVDLYALGCVLFALLAGRPPFVSRDTGALVRAHRLSAPPPLPCRTVAGEWIPPRLRALVSACLEKSPASRPAAARDIGVILGRLALRAGR